jgi:hypothetical protein
MSYVAKFDRISRNHDIEPLVVGDDGDDIAEQVYAYAFPRCASRDISVTVDMDKLTGTIFAGMHVAGSFTLEPGATP